MKKYTSFDIIKKADIASFNGLEREVSFGPITGTELIPFEISRFGITNPDKNYYIRRSPSPCFIIEYVVGGKGYLTVNGVTHTLTAGDSYIIHPGDYCEYYADQGEPFKKLWINFRCSVIFELLSAYGINERVIHGLDLSPFFEQIFALEEISDWNDELYLPASRIVFDMLFEIAQFCKTYKKSREYDLAANVKDILQHSLNVPISLADIEQDVYRSQSEIIKQFKAAYGITPYAYLIDLRIQLAADLLRNTDKKILEIAEYLCFSSEFHFSNCFKQKMGLSPRFYRKEYRKGGYDTAT